jgi:Fe-S cluster assembly iron-binding protein IscA
MIEISDEVKIKIREILDQNPGKCLRIDLEGDGCAGPYLGVSLAVPEENETMTRVNGIDILIPEQVKRYAEVANINIFLNPTGQDTF